MITAPFTKVTLHYLTLNNSATLGLGENVKLLLEDAGIEHEYVRYTWDNWPAKKEQLLQDGYYLGTVPMLEIEGRRIGKTVPIMRYISKKLGKYQGSNDEDCQLLDALSDAAMDWVRLNAFAMYHGTEAQKKEHKEKTVPKYLGIFEKAYTERDGPYILGQEISYVDFIVYHRISEENADYKAFPHVKAFMKTFAERPNLKKHLSNVGA
ncbi:hypothetical protein DFQ28_010527 [Apophysomyces sp. BC1034]|nr:hypothetical protein DFQ30_010010 [Apophysomyces sp. BC1015]KAG0171054.1 hypothetical protein DFQ29_009018 [Apophysomyces sp. BC1021]KAG0184764.1 hypothetical protein DFQ28_010527 [Apophysomyces sp. BC1034]